MYEFHVLNLGQFSRNRFWGELDSQSYREPLCTSTLVLSIDQKLKILVDPSHPPEEMARILFNRRGIRPADIQAVFVTHEHGDHYVGIEAFDHAPWFMSQTSLEAVRGMDGPRAAMLAEKFRGLDARGDPLLKEMEMLPLPGHTPGTMGLLFQSPHGRVCICGDAVMTRDFFTHRLGYYNSLDFEASTASIQKIAGLADLVVPGHDNYFLNPQKPQG